MKREWGAAVAAHDGRPCRVCLAWPRELAHVLPRTWDRERGRMSHVEVHPLAVIPLCPTRHRQYDAHRLDLAPHLTLAELEHAARRVGRERALAWITPEWAEPPWPRG